MAKWALFSAYNAKPKEGGTKKQENDDDEQNVSRINRSDSVDGLVNGAEPLGAWRRYRNKAPQL